MAPIEKDFDDEFEYYSNDEVKELQKSSRKEDVFLEKVGEFIAFLLSFSILERIGNVFKYVYHKIDYVFNTYDDLPDNRRLVQCSFIGRPIRPFFTKGEIKTACGVIAIIMSCFFAIMVLANVDLMSRNSFSSYLQKDPERIICMDITRKQEHNSSICPDLFKRRDDVKETTETITHMCISFVIFIVTGVVAFITFMINTKTNINISVDMYKKSLDRWFDSKKEDALRSSSTPLRPVVYFGWISCCLFIISLSLFSNSTDNLLTLCQHDAQSYNEYIMLYTIMDAYIILKSLFCLAASIFMMCWCFVEYHFSNYQFMSKYDIYDIQLKNFTNENKITKLSLKVDPRDVANGKRVELFVALDQNNKPYIHEITNQ